MTNQLASYDTWSKQQIQDRSKELAELAAEVYPHPVNLGS